MGLSSYDYFSAAAALSLLSYLFYKLLRLELFLELALELGF
jgi:hypothetical protein